MKECPFINECEDEISESHFKKLCHAGNSSSIIYNYCATYQQMLRTKKGKSPFQKPREWKKEKEES